MTLSGFYYIFRWMWVGSNDDFILPLFLGLRKKNNIYEVYDNSSENRLNDLKLGWPILDQSREEGIRRNPLMILFKNRPGPSK